MKPVLTDEEIQAAVHHAYLDLTRPEPEGTDWIDKHPKEWANKAARYAERLTRERMAARIEKLEAGLKAVSDLIDSSRGVVGLHLNGDEAPWDELRTGGRFEEWLAPFDAALAAERGEEER